MISIDRKNIYRIAIPIIAVLAAAGAYFIYRTVQANRHSERSDILEKRAQELNRDNQPEGATTTRRLLELPLETKASNQLKPETCESLAADAKKNCLERLDFYQIIEYGNADDCLRLDKFRNDCLMRKGKAEDPQKCFLLKDRYLQDACLSGNSLNARNIEVCNSISDIADMMECKDRYKALTNGSLLPSGEKGDIKKCVEIHTKEYFNQCILRSEGDCSDLGDQTMTDKCVSIRGFYAVLQSGQAKNCDLLPDANYFKVCQAYFQNGQKLVDSDGDAVNDELELWFNTDPFVPELKEQKGSNANNEGGLEADAFRTE